MFIDLFASDHIEATIPCNPIKVSFYFKDILKVGPILPIGQQGFLSNVFALFLIPYIFHSKYTQYRIIIFKQLPESCPVTLFYIFD